MRCLKNLSWADQSASPGKTGDDSDGQVTLQSYIIICCTKTMKYRTSFKKNIFVGVHFIYYINRSIATKVDSTYLGY